MRNWIEVTGFVEVKHNSDVIKGNNLVVTAGKNLIASRLGSNTNSPVTFMAMGTGTTAAVVGQTALQGAELERVSATVATSNNLFQLEANFGSGIPFDTNFAEFGLFNSSSAGTMLARFVISERPFTAGDTLEVIWTLQFGS